MKLLLLSILAFICGCSNNSEQKEFLRHDKLFNEYNDKSSYFFHKNYDSACWYNNLSGYQIDSMKIIINNQIKNNDK